MSSILLITTGQPSTNPRAVKEATTLDAAGYEVMFIYNFWTEWGLPFDEKIIKENPNICWIMAGADPVNNWVAYNLSRIKHKYFRWLNKLFPKNITLAQQATIRGFSDLAKTVSKIKASLYVAHNLGALPVAAIASKRNNSKYAFDAEDYHRGQVAKGTAEYTGTVLLEDKYLPGAFYITAASPLIAEQYINHYHKPVTVINNVFSTKYLAKEIKVPTKPIKLFWFSQTIGKGRGLEDIILALIEMLSGEFSITLIGRHDDSIKKYFMDLGKNGDQQVVIDFLQPVSAEEIFEIAAQHDIGLALEQPGEMNRDLCLTNKIFTYLLAGNAIIFSETKAQRKFYEENSEIGTIYNQGDISGLIKILQNYHGNPKILFRQKEHSYVTANELYNWDIEMNTFKNLIEESLN